MHSLASGTAELASCLVLTPAEVIKQNAQMLRSRGGGGGSTGGSGGWRNSTSIQALRMVTQSQPGSRHGSAAHRLLTGYGALAARNLPFTALQFPMFEAIRRRLWEWRDDKGLVEKDGSDGGVGGGERKIPSGKNVARGLMETGLVNATSAAVSGAIAAVVTTPTDVVKTRMMLSAGEEENGNHHQQQQQQQKGQESGKQTCAASQADKGPTTRTKQKSKMSGWQVARLVYQERGLQGLFRGGFLRSSWTAVGSGLYLGTYEVAKVWLKGTDSDDGDGDDSL